MKKISLGIVLALVTTIFISCSSNYKISEKVIGVLTKEKVAVDQNLVAEGKQVFERSCSSCHGDNGSGIAGQGPRLNSPDFLGLASDDFIHRTITDGRDGTAMIGFGDSRRVKDKIPAVVAYIRSWQNDYAVFRDYQVDPSIKIHGDSMVGKKKFRVFCSQCHGQNGGGYADGGSGTAIGLSGFLNVASDDYIKKTVLVGRAGTAMKPFGHGRGVAQISEEDIDDIVSYLRSLQL